MIMGRVRMFAPNIGKNLPKLIRARKNNTDAPSESLRYSPRKYINFFHSSNKKIKDRQRLVRRLLTLTTIATYTCISTLLIPNNPKLRRTISATWKKVVRFFTRTSKPESVIEVKPQTMTGCTLKGLVMLTLILLALSQLNNSANEYNVLDDVTNPINTSRK